MTGARAEIFKYVAAWLRDHIRCEGGGNDSGRLSYERRPEPVRSRERELGKAQPSTRTITSTRLMFSPSGASGTLETAIRSPGMSHSLPLFS